MKLKTLKVFDGYIGGSTLERPKKPTYSQRQNENERFADLNEWDQALTAYDNSFLPMEDNGNQFSLLVQLRNGDKDTLPVGTEVSVDLEVEEVEQKRLDSGSLYEWRDVERNDKKDTGWFEYRQVLRIKQK